MKTYETAYEAWRDMILPKERAKLFGKTEQELIELMSEKGQRLQYLEEERQTPAICEAAVRAWPYAIGYVKEPTRELCMKAVQKDGIALMFLKREFRTREVCEAAFEQASSAFGFIPHEFQTEEMCIKRVRVEEADMRHVKNMTPAIERACAEGLANRQNMEKVKAQPLCVKSLPVQTRELWMEAVKRMPMLIKFSPYKDDRDFIEQAGMAVGQ